MFFCSLASWKLAEACGRRESEKEEAQHLKAQCAAKQVEVKALKIAKCAQKATEKVE